MMGAAQLERRASLLVGAACVLAALAWQAATVRYNYQGNWTALFCTGGLRPVPPALAAENIRTFGPRTGYDGQFYHYIAHDPFFRRGFSESVDAPRLRYRRILVPLLAHLLAAGRQDWIDPAYFAVILGFVFLGAWWLARYAVLRNRHPAWGVCFLVVPATVISLDRMTVDIALAALTVGFALYAAKGCAWKVYAVLVCAVLVRETGLLLLGAYGLSLLCRRQVLRAAVFGSVALPAAVWYWFVHAHTTVYDSPIHPLEAEHTYFDIFFRSIRRPSLPLPIAYVDGALEGVALAGSLLAVALGFRLLWKRRLVPEAIAAAAFALMAVGIYRFIGYQEIFGHARTLSPLFVLLALDGLSAPSRLAFLPLAMVLPRLFMQFGYQLIGVVKGLLPT